MNEPNQHLGHESGKLIFLLFLYAIPDFNRMTTMSHQFFAGFLHAGHSVVIVESNQTCTDIDRRCLDHNTVINQRQLGGTSSHINVEDGCMKLRGHVYRAAAVGRQQRFMVRTGRGADKFAGIFGEVLGNWLSIFLFERLTRDHHRAGVDVVPLQTCFVIGVTHKRPDFFYVDAGF